MCIDQTKICGFVDNFSLVNYSCLISKGIVLHDKSVIIL